MQTTKELYEASLFKSLITGLLLSAGFSLFFYFGTLITYNYLLESIIILVGIIVICSLILWINIRFDHMIDLTDVFSRTIAFDFEFSQPVFFRALRFLRPASPYIGVLVTISVLLLVLLGIPAMIICWLIHPGPPGTSLKIWALIVSVGTAMLYFNSNKDQFPSAADKAAFFTGTLLGLAGALKIVS